MRNRDGHCCTNPSSKKAQEAHQAQHLTGSISVLVKERAEVNKPLILYFLDRENSVCFTDKQANGLIPDSKYGQQAEHIEPLANIQIDPDLMLEWPTM